MRSILIALSLGVAAATVAYAHTADGSAPARSAGILTCRTLPNVSLVFGKTRVAACSFEADRSDFTQAYGAVLLPRADDDGTLSRTIIWRVVTAGGATRAAMLDGAFSSSEPGAILQGVSARLEPISEIVEAGVILGAADEARTEVGSLR